MLSFLPDSMEQYVSRHTSPEGTLFAELAAATRKQTDMPQMMVGPVEGALLRTLVRISRARRVLEVGTFTGYSTLAMAIALEEGGSVITCDIDEHATGIARRFWSRHPAGEKIDLRIAPALETIETIEGPFDMAFVDADKPNYIAYYESILPKLRPGGFLVADNVLWSGRVVDDGDSDEDTVALRAFNEHVSADPRVDRVMLAIRDGITVATRLA